MGNKNPSTACCEDLVVCTFTTITIYFCYCSQTVLIQLPVPVFSYLLSAMCKSSILDPFSVYYILHCFQAKIHLPETKYVDVNLNVTDTFLDCQTPT